MPLPYLSPSDVGKYTQVEMEAVVNEAGEYQKLADILADHPVIKFIIDEAKGMDSVRP